MITKSKDLVFKGLHVVAWMIFIALCIEAGSLVVNFIYSLVNPKVVHNLYMKLDLSDMYEKNRWIFFGIYSFLLFIALLKAYLFYIVIRLLMKFDLSNPFSSFVSEQINQISYYTFSIGIISYIAREIARNMEHHGIDTNKLNQFWADSQAYILMSAVIYIIATIITKGVEIQKENELTV